MRLHRASIDPKGKDEIPVWYIPGDFWFTHKGYKLFRLFVKQFEIVLPRIKDIPKDDRLHYVFQLLFLEYAVQSHPSIQD